VIVTALRERADYENLSAELVTSLAVVTAATTGRVRWSGVKVQAGTALLVPKMTQIHFDRLAEAAVKWVKFLFYPFSADTEEAATMWLGVMPAECA